MNIMNCRSLQFFSLFRKDRKGQQKYQRQQNKKRTLSHDSITCNSHFGEVFGRGDSLFALAAPFCFVPHCDSFDTVFSIITLPLGLAIPLFVFLGLVFLSLVFLVIRFYLKNKILLRIQKAVARLPIQCGVCNAHGEILFYKDNNCENVDAEPITLHDLPIEFQQEFEKVFPVAFETNERKTIEFDSYLTRYKVDITPLPMRDYGQPALLWVVHDVTDLTNAFAERTQTVQLLQNTLSSIGDAVISTNYDGEITLINPSAVHMANKPEAELMGKPFDDCFKFRDEEGDSLIKKVIMTRKSYPFHSEVKVNDSDDALYVDGLIAPIFEDQLIVGTVLYFHDTTDLVRQGQKLRLALRFAQTSDRAKSDFLATVNHEFRSSVNVIIGYCDLSSINSSGKHDSYIESIHSEAEKLLLMFNDILDVSKNNTDSMGITLAPVNFKDLVREIQRIFGWTSNNKKVSLDVRIDREIPVILSDYKALRQIMIRLLSQAYSLAGRESVLLAIKWDGEDLRIEISINSQKIQIRQSNNLLVFKRLCERLNGTLNFNQMENRLIFEVVLNKPQIISQLPTTSIPELEVAKARPRKNVVLLVDDIAINLKVLGAMLKKFNIESVPCTTTRAAMEEIGKYIPMAIFTDLWMPDVSGEEFANILLQNPETASIPRILITADTQLDKKIEKLFLSIIYKPLKPQELRKAWTLIEEHNSVNV